MHVCVVTMKCREDAEQFRIDGDTFDTTKHVLVYTEGPRGEKLYPEPPPVEEPATPPIDPGEPVPVGEPAGPDGELPLSAEPTPASGDADGEGKKHAGGSKAHKKTK